MQALEQGWRTDMLGAAVAEIEAGRAAAAAAACAALLRADPADADASLLLGLALGLAGDVAGAARVLDRLYRSDGSESHPAHALAELLRGQGRAEAVRGQLAACLALAPDDTELRLALAEQLHAECDAQAVIDLLAPLLAALPAHVPAMLLNGIALADLGHVTAASDAFRRVLVVAPETAAAWANLGMLLKIESDFPAAIDACDRAVALAPDDAQIRLNRAVALLRAGRMAEAWNDYEARLQLPGRHLLPIQQELPVVSRLPEPGLAGRRVLLTHEEGFGDSMQFLRYAPLLTARGARVMVWAPTPLLRLLREVGCFDLVIGPGEPLPPFDFHCPVSSLLRVFETTLDDVPPPLPYRADPRRAARFLDRLPPGRRIGLVWAGQARPWLSGFAVLDARRKLPLSRLARLGEVPGLQWISLQMGPAAAEAADSPFPLHQPMAGVGDFADTAAIIAGLEIVVSVDTSVVHLAASMGKPVLLLDRYDSCWRWLAGRVDSPWYPSLRIIRQAEFGDWDGVIARVAETLRSGPGRL